ncbi:MAG: hypothetical protein IPM60_05680 [Rhodospirillales bacterium]|nr:hypothetical protein [Rhodospirillales bacterium]
MPKARADHSVEEGIPASTRGAFLVIGLGLPKGVVDGDWEARMALLGEPVHRPRHAIKEKRLCASLVIVAVRKGDQFLGLRDR